MSLSAKQFAALCFSSAVGNKDKLTPEELIKKTDMLEMGFDAFEELKHNQKEEVVRWLQDMAVVRPDIVMDHFDKKE